ncbi:MAG TPA: OmpA family protein [Candidatus Kapabacteria bacterium]|nr:OmpA family protein [Candidatus Kapabacteria bacterium]
MTEKIGKIIIITLLMALVVSNKIFCEDTLNATKDYRVGVFSGLSYLKQSTNIPTIWGADYCGQFESGNKISYQIGIDFSTNLYKNHFWVDLRINYANIPAYFTKTNTDFRVFNPSSNKYENLNLKQDFEASTGYLMIEPGIIYQPILSLPIKAKLSLSAGNPIISNNYETSEEIESPKIYTFEDLSQKRITQSGKLNNTTTSLFGMFSFIYDKQIQQDLFLTADIYYAYPINSSLKDYEWKINKFGVNIGINYAFNLDEEQLLPPVKEKLYKETLDTAKTTVPNVDTAVIKYNNIPVQLRETVVTQTYPILPYIFFDSTSASLNEKYIQGDISSFDENKITKESLDIYYSMLNIIGSRLSKSNSTIEIIGMTDGTELSDKADRLKLANKRAEAVSHYLMSKWGIEKSKIKTSVRNVPQLATSIVYPEGNQENRRVEITSNDTEILKPLIHSKFKEYELIDSDLISSLTTNIYSIVGSKISNISMSFIQANLEVYKIELDSLPNKEFTTKINNKLKNAIQLSATNNSDIMVKISAKQDDSIDISASYKLETYKEKNNFELGRLNLIVFDFDKFEINEQNKNIIKQFVANSIFESSAVRIIGSTDRLGEKTYNMKLSQERAEEAYKYLYTLKPKANYFEIKGIGDSNLPYNNNLPEGRFYCRTVLIEVSTPIK